MELRGNNVSLDKHEVNALGLEPDVSSVPAIGLDFLWDRAVADVALQLGEHTPPDENTGHEVVSAAEAKQYKALQRRQETLERMAMNVAGIALGTVPPTL